jgi:hypothetical protein
MMELSGNHQQRGSAVNEFLHKHAPHVIGVLSGFDRLIFRGTIRQLAHAAGMLTYLNVAGVLLKDFGRHVLEASRRVKESLETLVTGAGRPIIYLPSSHERKGELAHQLAQRDGVDRGLICLFRTLEAGPSFEVHRDRAAKRLTLVSRPRRCLFLYLYQFHPQVGFMHVRLQSWFPFSVQVWINGREWLARQLDEAGLEYQRCDNCFLHLADPERAQQLMDDQLRTHWPTLLEGFADEIFPLRREIFGRFLAPYYWSVYQSEWASDVMFQDAASLAALYPRLIHHGIRAFSSPDVLRFLGRRVTLQGHPHGRFAGQVTSDLKHRPEGVRIKHRVDGNSVKLYDKHGSVLRFETTIHQPKDIKVYRAKEGDSSETKSWLKLRRGVADLHRRAQVSQAANDRYAHALLSVDATLRVADIAARLSKPATHNGRRVRGLRPWSPDDLALLQAVNRGEFVLTGLRNRDLCRLLYATPARDPHEQRRRSGRVSRQLRMLRAHGLIRKVPKTHRYLVTDRGREAITALLLASDATTEQLAKLAA